MKITYFGVSEAARRREVLAPLLAHERSSLRVKNAFIYLERWKSVEKMFEVQWG